MGNEEKNANLVDRATQSVNVGTAPIDTVLNANSPQFETKSETPVNSVVVNKETSNIWGTAPVPITPTVETPAPVSETPQQKFDRLNPAGTKIEDIKREEPKPLEQPAPQTPTATTPKADWVIDSQAEFDKFKGRENEVLTNLKNAYDSGVKDGDGIRKFASYDTATPEKKAAIDAFIMGKRNEEKNASSSSQFGNEDGIYSALVNNVSVPDSVKNTPNYKSASSRYYDYSKYSKYDANGFASLISGWQLIPWTKTYNDLYANPSIKGKLDNANKILSITGKSVDVGSAWVTETNKILAANPTLASALQDNELSPEEIKKMTSTPETDALSTSLAETKKKIDTLDLEAKNLEDSVRSQYPGISSWMLAIKVANGLKAIDKQRDSLRIAYNSDFGVYTDKKKDLISAFETNFKLYQDKKASEDKLSLIADERKYQEGVTDKKNTYDSVNAQIKFAQENGVDLQRTDANVIIADAKKYAEENGVSLQEALKETFTKPLTSKDSYKRALQAIYDKNSGALTDYQKATLAQGNREFDATMGLNYDKLGFDMKKFESEQNKPDWVQDKETGEWVNKNSNYKPGVTVDEKGQPFSVANYSTSRNGSTSVTCGQLTNDYIADVTWGTFTKRMGDSIESKEAVINELGESPTPVVGGLFTFRTNTPNGHTGIVSAVNPDGSIVVREANRSQSPDGKTPAETHKYSADFVKENMKFSVAPSTAAFYKDEYVADMVKIMGGYSRVSGEEWKAIASQAKGYMKEGLSARQAWMRVAGLRINDTDNEDFALDLFEKSRNFSDKETKSNFGPTISTFINSGDTEGALNYFEKQVDADVKKTYDKEAILSSQRMETKKWNNEIVNLVNSNRKDIGLINGTIADWKQKFEENPKLKRLNTILTKIQADERKYFAGSAVTATELDALRDFIGGNTKMNANDLIMQIKTLEEMSDSEFRSQRKPYGY